MLVIDPAKMLEEEGIECLTPDLPDEIIADIHSSPGLAPYKAALLDHARAEAELALHRQNRIKEASDRIERCYMDGIGRRVASIDKVLFDRLCRVWGPKWFRDPDRLHRVLEENPAMAVKCEGWRPQDRFSTKMKRRKLIKTYQTRNEREKSNSVAAGHAAPGDPVRPLQDTADARPQTESSGHETAGGNVTLHPVINGTEIPDARRPWALDVMSALRGATADSSAGEEAVA